MDHILASSVGPLANNVFILVFIHVRPQAQMIAKFVESFVALGFAQFELVFPQSWRTWHLRRQGRREMERKVIWSDLG